MRNCASEGALSANPESRDSGSGACAPSRNDGARTLRLALPLPLSPAGLIDLDRARERLVAAAITGAANRGCAEIIKADGNAGVGVGSADAVGGIEPDPAQIGHEGFRPGVT